MIESSHDLIGSIGLFFWEMKVMEELDERC